MYLHIYDYLHRSFIFRQIMMIVLTWLDGKTYKRKRYSTYPLIQHSNHTHKHSWFISDTALQLSANLIKFHISIVLHIMKTFIQSVKLKLLVKGQNWKKKKDKKKQLGWIFQDESNFELKTDIKWSRQVHVRARAARH